MAKENIDGLGHRRLVPDQLYADKVSHQIFDRNYDEALSPMRRQISRTIWCMGIR